MPCNGRFRIPCAMVTSGHVKKMSREALVMLIVDCYCIEHKFGGEAMPPPPELVKELSGLSIEEVNHANVEVLRAMATCAYSNGQVSSIRMTFDDMLKETLELENLPQHLVNAITNILVTMKERMNIATDEAIGEAISEAKGMEAEDTGKV